MSGVATPEVETQAPETPAYKAKGYAAKPIRSSIALAPSEGMPVRVTRRFS